MTINKNSSLQEFVDNVREWNIEAGNISEDHGKSRDAWLSDANNIEEEAFAVFDEEVQELQEAIIAQDDIETLDAAADCLYSLFSLLATAGLSDFIVPTLVEVVSSNDTKLIGGAHHNSRGKVTKGPHFEAPDIMEALKTDRLASKILEDSEAFWDFGD